MHSPPPEKNRAAAFSVKEPSPRRSYAIAERPTTQCSLWAIERTSGTYLGAPCDGAVGRVTATLAVAGYAPLPQPFDEIQ